MSMLHRIRLSLTLVAALASAAVVALTPAGGASAGAAAHAPMALAVGAFVAFLAVVGIVLARWGRGQRRQLPAR